MDYIFEPGKNIPVCDDVDLFVAGGSCTGVFAAVRAARLGLKVVLVERQNCLGGMATSAMVNVWHSLKDIDYKNQIIAGLTYEVTTILEKSGAALIKDDPSLGIQFDPLRLMYELDRLVIENKVKVYLHTLCVDGIYDNNEISAAIIENKDGRSAVKAKFFIDATGDGDLAKRLNCPIYQNDSLMPPTPCFILYGPIDKVDLSTLVEKHGAEFNLEDDFGWSSILPGFNSNFTLQASHHILNTDCSKALDLTLIETEGRRKIYALIDLLNKYSGEKFIVTALPSLSGLRESNHFETEYKVKGLDLLHGARHDDAVLNGTYRVDMHEKNGDVTFMYLDGVAYTMSGSRREGNTWNWREKEGLLGECAKYYQAPFKMLVQKKYRNFIAAGRMLNADKMGFGALRVMVNLNQLGEASGVAAYLAINSNKAVYELDGTLVRKELNKGGSCL